MPNFPIIDSHVRLYDIDSLRYGSGAICWVAYRPG